MKKNKRQTKEKQMVDEMKNNISGEKFIELAFGHLVAICISIGW